ncbi:MAG: AbrB/MazE/SpoVT family DNA-binding domain-containing protein [Deltaproteobacteria bacterium]|nr:AbrB/MazE/SpoVT family DNA-binding domain-containing protein [Deltaproteobacteria bacterium]
MNNQSTVSERGQITLPKELRDRMGLKPGTSVRFVPSPKGILIQRDSAEDPMGEVFGVLKDGIRTDDYLKETRGKAE